MSDAARVTQALDSGELAQWFRESGAKEECLQCSAKEWTILVDKNRATGMVITDNDAIDLATFVPLIGMLCRNCGYIRTHSLVQFLKWQDSKKEHADGRDADPQ